MHLLQQTLDARSDVVKNISLFGIRYFKTLNLNGRIRFSDDDAFIISENAFLRNVMNYG